MARNYNEYDDLGVRFIYPKNWFVRTETWDKGTYSITVDTPEGSFWTLSIMPKGVDLDKAAQDIVRTMNAEYDDMEEREIKRYVADYVLTGYEIDFFYLDLTSTATALKFEDERRGYVIFWQTCEYLIADDNSDSRADIFDAMTHTLVSNLTGQEDDWSDEEDEAHFEQKLSEQEVREQEEREYLRRKYERMRRKEEERNWRRSDDDYPDDDTGNAWLYQAAIANDERIKDFLRASTEVVDLDVETDELDKERHRYDVDDEREFELADEFDDESDDDL